MDWRLRKVRRMGGRRGRRVRRRNVEILDRSSACSDELVSKQLPFSRSRTLMRMPRFLFQVILRGGDILSSLQSFKRLRFSDMVVIFEAPDFNAHSIAAPRCVPRRWFQVETGVYQSLFSCCGAASNVEYPYDDAAAQRCRTTMVDQLECSELPSIGCDYSLRTCDRGLKIRRMTITTRIRGLNRSRVKSK